MAAATAIKAEAFTNRDMTENMISLSDTIDPSSLHQLNIEKVQTEVEIPQKNEKNKKNQEK